MTMRSDTVITILLPTFQHSRCTSIITYLFYMYTVWVGG